jgi:prevent-host-death family protein
MITNPFNIIPITKARGKLGDLAEKVSKNNYIILTKDGSPKAALVDVSYLTNLEKQVQKVYKKTFIDAKLLRYTRKFTDKEIKEWEKEDIL